MEIVRIDKKTRVDQESFIALGNFDGVHRAHQEIIKTLVTRAREKNLASSVLIFKQHTKDTLTLKEQPLLSSQEQKYQILEDLGVDFIYEMDFNRDIMNLEARVFVEDLLLDHLSVRGIVVGFDYRFGHKASGNTDSLRAFQKDMAFDLYIVDKVEEGDLTISSTLIRQLIKEGDLVKAGDLLGRPYTLAGLVETGKGLGRKIGIPTANLRLDTHYCVPKFGVYHSHVILEGKTYLAATNIGKNPTFNETGLKVEAHILDFDQDIYGKKVSLALNQFIREEISFDSIEELVDQMEEDISLIKKLNSN
ncbi:MAG: bifunctional riboflavin kinase/FAD synthetase [Tissierellia bacterium]|nr:bifunctional riboflavin kinase/FAD synthetase [Tissierellia bacterium]